MRLKCHNRVKDGKDHRYWSIVESVRCSRERVEQSAMADLLEEDFSLAAKDNLYRALDKLAAHKADLFSHLQARWKDMFGATFDVLLYDLTSTYFECSPKGGKGLQRFGYSRDKRSDCVQVVIALPPRPLRKAALRERVDFTFKLDRQRLRIARRREGRYLLRSNLTGTDPGKLWQMYLQLTQVEQAFKDLKGDLGVRPVYHQKDSRIEAHIMVCFLAYCVHVTLRAKLQRHAAGLTPRQMLDHLGKMQMIDVRLPATDGRELLLRRRTEPNAEQQLLLAQLQLVLPQQPPPKITGM